jgi:flagellar hook-length control protein FliK
MSHIPAEFAPQPVTSVSKPAPAQSDQRGDEFGSHLERARATTEDAAADATSTQATTTKSQGETSHEATGQSRQDDEPRVVDEGSETDEAASDADTKDADTNDVVEIQSEAPAPLVVEGQGEETNPAPGAVKSDEAELAQAKPQQPVDASPGGLEPQLLSGESGEAASKGVDDTQGRTKPDVQTVQTVQLPSETDHEHVRKQPSQVEVAERVASSDGPTKAGAPLQGESPAESVPSPEPQTKANATPNVRRDEEPVATQRDPVGQPAAPTAPQPTSLTSATDTSSSKTADTSPVNEPAPPAGGETSRSTDADPAAPETKAPLGENSLLKQGGGTVKVEGEPPIDTQTRIRLVQRVAKAFQAAGERGGQVRLRLSPPELGALRVEISIERGALTARIEAETPQARAMLLDNLPALRERLAEQEIRVAQFDIELMDHSHSHRDDSRWDDVEGDHQSTGSQPSRQAAADDQETTPGVADLASGIGGGALNVIV